MQQEQTNKQNHPRWLESALKQARAADVKLPWQRGEDRSGWKSRCADRAKKVDPLGD